MSSINEAYINSLPSLHGKPKVSIDLNSFERFNVEYAGLVVKFSPSAINIAGKDKLPERLRIHVNAAASIVVLMEDAENGFELRQMQGYRHFIRAAEVIKFLEEKGVKLPVKVKLIYDGELGGWVARLPKENTELRIKNSEL